MPGGEKTILAGGDWKGLNKAVSPHLLSPGESSDTFDAGTTGDVSGILGPRKGRTTRYTASSRIMGLIPCNFPWGRYRIVLTDDGTWAGLPVPWPAASTPTPLGWDRIVVDGLVVSRTNDGDTYSAAWGGFSKTLASYGVFLIGGLEDYLSDLAMTYSGGMADGHLTLQGRIDNAWTDLWRVTIVDGASVDQQQLYQTAPTGTFDAVRGWAHITSGGGNISGTFRLGIYLVYGTELNFTEAAA